jgi:hypothetical protein
MFSSRRFTSHLVTTFASVLYRICKLLPSARVCISYHYNMAAYIVNSTINWLHSRANSKMESLLFAFPFYNNMTWAGREGSFGGAIVRASGFHLWDRGFDSRYGLMRLMWKESVNALPKVVMGFLRVLRFPPTGNVDRVGWDYSSNWPFHRSRASWSHMSHES